MAVGMEIAGELGAKCAVAAALEVGKAAGARAAGNCQSFKLFFLDSYLLNKDHSGHLALDQWLVRSLSTLTQWVRIPVRSKFR